ncbi:MAG: DUF790 family protein [Myxococcota bacterium]|nr:DUF790 family protein [Myxococcota bacterium]
MNWYPPIRQSNTPQSDEGSTMLTGNLLRVKVGRSDIRPLFISPQSPKNSARAEQLIAIFNRALEEKMARRDIEDWIQELSSLEVDHKVFKGFAKVLFDRSRFSIPTLPLEDPPTASQIREEVFTLAAQEGPYSPHGILQSRSSVQEVWELVARKYGCEVEALQHYLYSDLRDMHRLQDISSFNSSQALIQRYNIALCQAILLRATELNIELKSVAPKWLRYLFHVIKFHKLMFTLEKKGEILSLKLDGPQSLFKQSTRYGMQLALFFPALLLVPSPWSLEGKILWNNRRKKFVLSHEAGLKSHYSERGVWRSDAEVVFEDRFQKSENGWSIQEGTLLKLKGQRLLIPDFCFQKGKQKVYMEIVGFWRKGQLSKLISSAPKNLILAVSKRLAGDKSTIPKSLEDRVIPFAEVIPLNKVVKALDRIAKE